MISFTRHRALSQRNHPQLIDTIIISMKTRTAYTITLGLFFLIEGIWGLFSPVVFGVFSTNILHSAIHIALGVWGVWAGRRGPTRGYLLCVGILLLVVGLLWFIPGAGDLTVRLLNVNRAVAVINVVVGLISLFVARGASPVVAGHS